MKSTSPRNEASGLLPGRNDISVRTKGVAENMNSEDGLPGS